MEDDDDADDEQEMNVLENNLNHEQEQLNRLQGISIISFFFLILVHLLEQIRNIQRHLLFDLNNQGQGLEEMDDDDEDEDSEDAEVGKISQIIIFCILFFLFFKHHLVKTIMMVPLLMIVFYQQHIHI
jgi:hypothetical protein